MKKSLISFLVGTGILLALNPQTAKKDELLKIKGVGEVKANAIISYRKSHKLKTKEDLMQVKGIGESIANNILKDIVNTNNPKETKKSKKKKENNKNSKETKKQNSKSKDKSKKDKKAA